MKKTKILFITLLIPVLLFTGCNQDIQEQNLSNNVNIVEPNNVIEQNNVVEQNNIIEQNNEVEYSVENFYPFEANIEKIYDGIGNEYAEQTIYTEFISNNRIQERIANPGITLSRVLEIKDGELRKLISEEETYYRKNIIDAEYNDYDILIKEPIKVGNTWTSSSGNKRYISSLDKKIETPAGKFQALEIITENDDSKMYKYYVLDKGLVKTVYESSDYEVITTLSSINKDFPIVEMVNFYYPNYDEDKINKIEKKIEINTNDDIRDIFEKNFFETPDTKLNRLIGETVEINEINLNGEKMIVEIDFSNNFVEKMNAGAGLEADILQCITNTLGAYYGVNKVVITIDGNLYSSGHILMEKDEVINTNLSNVEEFK